MLKFHHMIMLLMLLKLFDNHPAYVNQTIYGNFSSKSCSALIDKVRVPCIVNKCTKEIFVYFMCGFFEKSGFLNKNLELTEESSRVECDENIVKFIETDQFSIDIFKNQIFANLKKNEYYYILKFFFYNFINDVNDFVFISVILLLGSIFFLFLFKFKYWKSSI